MYTVDYFIKKFEAIPEEEFCRFKLFGKEGSQKCAIGHCLIKASGSLEVMPEFFDLRDLFSTLNIRSLNYGVISDGTRPTVDGGSIPWSNKIPYINNGLALEYQQPTAKQRILAALHDIKKMQSIQSTEEIINSVLSSQPDEIVVNQGQN